jgi:hypothetical protein
MAPASTNKQTPKLTDTFHGETISLETDSYTSGREILDFNGKGSFNVVFTKAGRSTLYSASPNFHNLFFKLFLILKIQIRAAIAQSV